MMNVIVNEMMNVIVKVVDKLYKNFKILWFSLFTGKDKKVERSKSRLMWNRTFAISCGAYPVYFPKRREITDTFWGNFFLLTRLFVWLSYRNINRKLKKKNSIYVSLNEMDIFMWDILPKIRVPFVLVTGDSDYSTSKFKDILRNKYLLHWFAQNNDIEDRRVSPIPIGLNYASLIFGDAFGEVRKSVEEQEQFLINIKNSKTNFKMKVFANFHLNCTSKRRRELYDLLKNNSFMYFQDGRMPRTEMWKLQRKFAFNFSPIGGGTDCVRTWEALAVGQIPIAERTNTPLDDLHGQFPIVIIDDVSEINETNLKKWYKKYSKIFNSDIEKKLSNKYWIKLIGGK